MQWTDVSKEVLADLANLESVFQIYKDFDWKRSEKGEREAFREKVERTRGRWNAWVEMGMERGLVG